ncbi:MAG: ISAzo13-like element transposase-related protein [Bryobacteraceae bacterium]
MDSNLYPAGIRIPDKELALVNLHRDSFHGEWNYEIRPISGPNNG